MCLRKYTLKKEKAFLAYRQHVCMCVLSHSVLSDSFSPMNCRPLGSSVHGILQASILEWVVIFFSRASSWPRGWTCIFCTADRLFTTAPLGKHRWHGESEWMMVFPGPIGVSESGRWSVQCRHFLSLRRDPSSLAFQPLCWVLKNWPLLIVRGYGFPPLPPSGRQEPLPSLHSNSCQKERQLSPRMRTLPLRPQMQWGLGEKGGEGCCVPNFIQGYPSQSPQKLPQGSFQFPAYLPLASAFGGTLSVCIMLSVISSSITFTL